MAKDLAAAYPVVREYFAVADDVLGVSLSSLCFDGPEADLNDTYNTQPALFVAGVATLEALRAHAPQVKPVCAAGHSLGELTAFYAAGALSFADGLRLVRERGRVMKAAGQARPGAMAALLGLDADAVRAVCQQATNETGGTVVLANDNCPGQIVISGEVAALDHAMGLAKAAGAKRAIKLAVSIASHSPLMNDAAREFQTALNQASVQPAALPVFGNVTAEVVSAPEAIRSELTRQLTGTVRWTESVRAMVAHGATEFVELGPKDVLAGLIRKIDPAVTVTSINSQGALESFLQNA
jgi:[acyl-carrier-protein] S-malonyltransferase